MDTLVQDIRYGFRMLLKHPAFTAVAVLSLALGIGANTTIFSLISAVFLNPLSVKDSGSLVAVYTTDERNKGGFNDFLTTSNPNFEDYRSSATAFAGMAAHQGVPLTLIDATGAPAQIPGEIVSGDYFDLLGVKPSLGRAFLPEEDRTPGTHLVAVLSDAAWKARFAGDRGIVGRTITLNNQAFTVIGVAPEGFRGVNAFGGPAIWVPMNSYPQVTSGFFLENIRDRRALLFNIIGRIKPGVTVEQARAELRTIGARLESEYPVPNKDRNSTLLPIAQATINPNLRRVFVMAGGLLMTVVALVLLIACANVANLLLSRAAARRREIAVRLSLGAARGRLVRQLLTESLLLALLGGAAGLLIAFWGKDLLMAFRPPLFFPDDFALALDGRVLGFTLLIAVVTGLLFGAAPALQASRPDLAVELKDRTSQPSRRRGRFNLRSVLVVAQVALSLVSLVGAGLFLRSLQKTQTIDPGFDVDNAFVVGFDLGTQGYDEVRGREYERRLLETAAAIPGVRSASLATNLPIGAGGFGRTVFPEGQQIGTGAVGQFTTVNSVSTNYLDSMGIRILRGRGLTDADRQGTPRVVVANEAMARQFWPGQDAVGKRFKFFGDETFAEIVGVAETTKLFTLSEDPSPIAYLPALQVYEPAMNLHVRTTGDPGPVIETVRRAVQELEPRMPLTNVQRITDLIGQTLWMPRMGASLLAVFGALALLLAAIGIYGVMSYAVSQRTQEFGIRMALGARRGDVLTLVLRQGLVLVAVGVGLGLAASLVAARSVAALLFGVSANDPVTFASIALLLSAVALFAGYIPARRATRVDPMVALRYE